MGRIVDVGKSPPTGRWFTQFFISPIYTIPKKRVIGQPQKWRLIQNLSSHTLGHEWSINGGIKKDEFPVTNCHISLYRYSGPRGVLQTDTWMRAVGKGHESLLQTPTSESGALVVHRDTTGGWRVPFLLIATARLELGQCPRCFKDYLMP